MTVQSTSKHSGGDKANKHGHANGHAKAHKYGLATRAIHVGSEADPVTGAVIPPISLSTTFKQDGVGIHKGFEYSRSDNPTRNNLEKMLASLDGGAESIVFSSGSGATAALSQWVTLPAHEGGAGAAVGTGHILSVNDVYGGTYRYLSRVATSLQGIEVDYLDMIEAGEAGIRAAIREDTKLIWVELPTNPLLLLPPLQLLSSIIHSLPALPARPLLVLDTTFLSPYYLTPLLAPIKADIVLSSLSKYLGGHSDVISGALTLAPHLLSIPEGAGPGTKSPRDGFRFLQNSSGAIPSPFDCYLLTRGAKSLAVRMQRHGLNALKIAKFLQDHPKIATVTYPGLLTHPKYHEARAMLAASARKDLTGLGWSFDDAESQNEKETQEGGTPFGGMLSFRVKLSAGTALSDAKATEAFLLRLKLFTLAESLGGVESLVEVPAGMTHGSIPAETRAKLGITDNLVRLSVGIEDADDLIHDLEQALMAV